MEFYSIIIILLAVAVGLSPIATKIKLPYPVLLLLAGIGVGFIPGFHGVGINPEVAFLIFLPPMLYDAAYNIHFKGFVSNISTISALAITLVFVTTAAIATTVHFTIGLSWQLSFVLGAILSPPDAVAAASATKGLGLPQRTNIVLEGESLINDASALVAFRFAVAAVAGSTFVFWQAGISFVITLAGGFLIGLGISAVFVWLTRKRKLDSNVIVTLHLMLPFVAYLIAENLHVSGVIAVVVAGLMVARRKNLFSEKTTVQSKSLWETITFILNGLIFILIGIEFPHTLQNIPASSILPLTGCAFLIFAVALLVRMLVIFEHKASMKKRLEKVKMQFSKPQHLNMRHRSKPFLRSAKNIGLSHRIKRRQIPFEQRLHIFETLLLTSKEAIVIGWSGMRGIVSLASALSLPLLLADGSVFPQRDTILFLTVVVVILMLVIQGLGLPLLVKVLKINETEHVVAPDI
ncbi:MAG: cation:proton antiporter [Prevotellaceae bacterium]|jgi:CPA1 family monovalent cation:H+ antiporter|nr:cation:proton antiporter [Prevotellaceae bacterium]